MKKILISFLFGAGQLLSTAQPIPLYGFTNEGGRHGDGGFFELKDGNVTVTPFRRELCFPTTNFVSTNGKVYGIADVSYDGRFLFGQHCVFEAETPTVKIKGVRQGMVPGAVNNPGGFSVSNDSLFACVGSSLALLKLNSFQVDTLVLLNLSTPRLIPLYHLGKLYYVDRVSTDYCLMEYNLATKTSRLLAKMELGMITNLERYSFIEGNSWYFTLKGLNGGSTLNKVSLNDSTIVQVHNFGAGSGQGVIGQYATVGNWQYNSCSAGGVNGKGFLFRFNSTTGAVQVIKDFATDYSSPIYGTVAFQDKIYGITSSKNGTNDAAVYTFNPSDSSFAILAEFPDVNAVGYAASGLLAHNNELYVFGARGGEKANGSVHKLNVATGSYDTNAPYTFKNFGTEYGKPVYANDKFYSVTDSVFYSYSPDTKVIAEEIGMPGNSKMGGDYPGLTVYNGLIYGSVVVGDYPANKLLIYSYNPVNQDFSALKEVAYEHFGQWDEMIIKNNNLYMCGGFDTTILKLNLTTLDTTIIGYPTDYGDPITKFSLIGNDIYYITSTYSGTKRNAIFKLNMLNDQLELYDDLNSFPDTIVGNMVEIEGKLYGVARATGKPGYMYSYDVVTKQLEKVSNDEDTISLWTNIDNAGSLIYWAKTSMTDAFVQNFSICTFDVNSKEFNEYPVTPSAEIGGVPMFVVSTLSSQNGIEDEGLAKELTCSLYPNPAVKQATVQFKTAFTGTITLVDLAGRVVGTTVVKTPETSVKLNTTDLINGVYLVKCTSAAGQNYTTRSLVVNR